MRHFSLPDPYIPEWPYTVELHQLAVVTPASANFPTNNRAIFLPVVFPVAVKLYQLAVQSTSSTGNWDLGLYDDELRLIVSKGSTANAVGKLSLTLPEYLVHAGRTYYAAMAMGSISSSTIIRVAPSVSQMSAIGAGAQDTAFPLPSTLTPIAPPAFAPLFAFGVR